jgi:ABC-type multidrug transport system fused ATPase/permease subunit
MSSEWLTGEFLLEGKLTTVTLRLANVIITSAIVAMILGKPGISGAEAGFMLSFSSEIVSNIGWLLRRIREFETKGVNLERIAEYRGLEQEDHTPWDQQDRAWYEQPAWPQEGAVEVTSLSARYGPDMPEILHKVSFNVMAGERVGIVGSTGGGKSTLAKTFFRFVDITHGSIKVDGLGELKRQQKTLPANHQILLSFHWVKSGQI